MSSFHIYLIGFLVVIAGLSMLASLIGVPPLYICAGALTLAGVGVIAGVSKQRRPDDSQA